MNLFRFHPKKKTSSRPKQRTALSSVAQWRDPWIFVLAVAFAFALAVALASVVASVTSVILTLSNVGWGGTAHFVFAVAWFSSGQSYQSAAPTTSRIPPSLPSKN